MLRRQQLPREEEWPGMPQRPIGPLLRLQDSNPDLTAPKAVVLPLHQGGTRTEALDHPPTTGRLAVHALLRPRWGDAAGGRGRSHRRCVGT